MLCGIYLGVKTSTSKGQLKVVYYEIDDLALFCNSTLYTKNYKASVYLCRHKPKNLEVLSFLSHSRLDSAEHA